MNENIEIKKIIGFNEIEEQFQKSISIRNNQTWLLIGKKGLGKRSLSMRFAGYIINKFDVNWETSELTNEVFNKKTDNLHYITALDEKNSGKISKEQIDILSSKFKLFASNLNYRVVIIDKFNWLTDSAMNSMLKILEEPPVGVYFLLIADELNNILPTIQSRSQKVFFRNLTLDECKNIVTLNNSLINNENLDDIIKLSNYSPGLSIEINSFSGLSIYQELLNTFINKQTIRDFSKKIVSTSKNNLSNIWIVEFLFKKFLSNCLRYSINKELINNSLILNENQIIKAIQKNKNNNDLLDILDNLNYRIKRVKNFNLSLELEVYQFLNQFH